MLKRIAAEYTKPRGFLFLCVLFDTYDKNSLEHLAIGIHKPDQKESVDCPNDGASDK